MADFDRAKDVFSGTYPPANYLNETEGGALLLFVRSAKEGIFLTPKIKEAIRGNRRPIPHSIIRSSMTEILCSYHPEAVRDMHEIGLLSAVLPELAATFSLRQKNPHHVYTVGEHTLQTVLGVPKEPILRWAALLHDLGKSRTHTVDMAGVDHFHGHEEASARIAEGVMTRLSFKEEDKAAIRDLVRYHDFRPPIWEAETIIDHMGRENAMRLLLLQEADARAQNPAFLAPKLQYLDALREAASLPSGRPLD